MAYKCKLLGKNAFNIQNRIQMMKIKDTCIAAVQCSIIAVLLAASAVNCHDQTPIPGDPSQIGSWFAANVKPLSQRKGTLNPALEAAEAHPKVIRVTQDGTGDFSTITDAVNSIPAQNTQRVIVYIGQGVYREKVTIGRDKPFITFYGTPGNRPTLAFDGTAKEYGTVYSATLQVDSDYFTAANIILRNTAPRPDGKSTGQQALAFRIGGDMASFYNCKFLGFQDTLCDDKGHHFFKDCYIEGTVDFIFGNGKSIYLNTNLYVIANNGMAFITAHARSSLGQDTGFAFVHGSVTGIGQGAMLGRAWKEMPLVVFAYTTMSSVVSPSGWSHNFHPERQQTVSFAEYKCKGPGASPNTRVKFAKQLGGAEATHFLTLAYIDGSKWLLPPPKV